MSGATIGTGLLLLFVYCSATIIHGQKEWTIGEDKGWNFGVSGWEDGKRFRSSDVLVFKYDPKMHNMVQVGEGDYNSCTVTGPSKTYTSGLRQRPCPSVHVKLSGGGKDIFISSISGQCGARHEGNLYCRIVE